MIRGFRSSLFWTFAGAFLIVLVLATLLQGVVIVAVVNSLALRFGRERAESVLDGTARDIEKLGTAAPDPEIARLLRAEGSRSGPIIVALRHADGRLVLPHRFPPFVQNRVRALIAGEKPPPGAAPPSDYETPDLPDSAGNVAGGLPPPSPGADLPPLEWRGRGRGPAREFRVLARRPVAEPAGPGELVALAPAGRFAFWPPGALRRVLLFLPIAVVLAGAAGTVLFRSLVRRLTAVETLAGRITRGDLDARVPEGPDEIGRLGARLNRMTETLGEARRHLEENDRQRRRLLADITHELATPLTSIRGYTQTLLDPNVPVSGDERIAYLRNVLEESERMDLLIGDLLDLTRLEAGAAELVPVRLDLAALALNTLERLKPRFREAGLNLEWEGGHDPAWVRADGRRLEQVLDNLLTNALRYVPAGGTVSLSVARAPGPAAGTVRLTIVDTGPGIPAADLPHIFDRFYRAGTARSLPGSGLGLAIVREIVTRHGGRVTAESPEGGGTRMMVDLPADAGG